ncbi:unnamed protein product [Ostreobium quekettii]|uniref:Disease resistance R13L4/SHOC-2-like LRR domain-containing protein n=1 Tax=Ostreobium quekettii TaxID=121088 RepID=A0A8S1J0X9_9CHLO|nr:unnamed protein product [Ostreobium quekettii]|eukprot:evm.model.scf_736EXC.8 EVM.evm.TU.scf_736EXC.8   scf_736EXC:55644-56651(-)
MGNCCGQLAPSPAPKNRQQKAQRQHGWAATGVVALRDERLKELPVSIGDIGSKVTAIDATNNRISALPAFTGSLSRLQRLVLTKNDLDHLPPDLWRLSQLKVLVLDYNSISSLPAGLGELTLLERLSVAANNLSALPESVGRLARLRQLNVAKNQLREIPESIGSCSDLEDIDATDNYLQGIPMGLERLGRLRTLTLDKNSVASIPEGVLMYCTSLQTLSLQENPISMDQLQATAGYDLFEKRRKGKVDKAIASGVMLGSNTMAEAIERRT